MVAKSEHYQELERAFRRGATIIVCWQPGCSMHRLRSWQEGEWEPYPRRNEYPRYSHGICGDHFRKLEQETGV